jgi:hypothetical protein
MHYDALGQGNENHAWRKVFALVKATNVSVRHA